MSTKINILKNLLLAREMIKVRHKAELKSLPTCAIGNHLVLSRNTCSCGNKMALKQSHKEQLKQLNHNIKQIKDVNITDPDFKKLGLNGYNRHVSNMNMPNYNCGVFNTTSRSAFHEEMHRARLNDTAYTGRS